MEFRTCEADKESVFCSKVSCLEPGVRTTFWLSWDKDIKTIKFGTGYAMEETGEEEFFHSFRKNSAMMEFPSLRDSLTLFGIRVTKN